MDSVIPSFMAPAGAPPPAGTAPAGSSTELAAIFEDLVDRYSGESLSLSDDQGSRGQTAGAVADLDPDAAEQAESDAEDAPPPGWPGAPLPWQWTIEPAPAPGGGDIGITDAPLTAAPAGDATLADDTLAPGPAGTEPADAGFPSARTPGAVDRLEERAADAASAEAGAPVQAATDGPGSAARALAKALAGLQDSQPAVHRPAPRPAPDGAPSDVRDEAGRLSQAADGSLQFSAELQAQATASAAGGPAARTAMSSGEEGNAVARDARQAVDLPAGSSLPAGGDPGVAIRAAASTLAVQGGSDTPQHWAAALADANAAQEAERAQVPNQIVRAMRLQVRDGGGEVRLQLRPEFLGEVRIDLKVEGDRVNASMQVERADVRQYIESTGQTLRQALAAQGLQLDELTVRDQDASRRDTPEQQQERRQMPRRQGQRDGDKAFEIPL